MLHHWVITAKSSRKRLHGWFFLLNKESKANEKADYSAQRFVVCDNSFPHDLRKSHEKFVLNAYVLSNHLKFSIDTLTIECYLRSESLGINESIQWKIAYLIIVVTS